MAPTGHLNGLRCGKTKLYFGSVFYNKNILQKTQMESQKMAYPRLRSFGLMEQS